MSEFELIKIKIPKKSKFGHTKPMNEMKPREIAIITDTKFKGMYQNWVVMATAMIEQCSQKEVLQLGYIEGKKIKINPRPLSFWAWKTPKYNFWEGNSWEERENPGPSLKVKTFPKGTEITLKVI